MKDYKAGPGTLHILGSSSGQTRLRTIADFAEHAWLACACKRAPLSALLQARMAEDFAWL